MAYLPTLDPMALRVLDILLERSNIPGYELMKRAGSDDFTGLASAVAALRKEDLVQISGDVSNPQGFTLASFAVRPSAKEFAYIIAKQNR